MATSLLKSGPVVPWTNGTGSAVVSGAVVIVGTMCAGIASVDIANGATGSVQTEGVFSLDKNTSDALTQGAPVWWDASAGECINAVALNAIFLGFAEVAAGASDTTCQVRLAKFTAEGPRTLTLAATGAVTLTAADLLSGDLFCVVPSTGAQTLNVPSVTTIPFGAKLTCRKTTSDAVALTIDPASAEQINGGNTYTSIDAQNDRATFRSTGAAWVLEHYTIA